jgi:hypothetical protein
MVRALAPTEVPKALATSFAPELRRRRSEEKEVRNEFQIVTVSLRGRRLLWTKVRIFSLTNTPSHEEGKEDGANEEPCIGVPHSDEFISAKEIKGY